MKIGKLIRLTLQIGFSLSIIAVMMVSYPRPAYKPAWLIPPTQHRVKHAATHTVRTPYQSYSYGRRKSYEWDDDYVDNYTDDYWRGTRKKWKRNWRKKPHWEISKESDSLWEWNY